MQIWEELVDARTVGLTFNNNTVYTWFWLNLKDGPPVIEAPPMVYGIANDMYFRWIGDLGITGQDRGKGGKYLLLPPGYKGDVPGGYFVLQSRTLNVVAGWRTFLEDGSTMPETIHRLRRFHRFNDLPVTGTPGIRHRKVSTAS